MAKKTKPRPVGQLMRELIDSAKLGCVAESLIDECEAMLKARQKQAKRASKAGAASGRSGRPGVPEATKAAIINSLLADKDAAVEFGLCVETVRRIRRLARKAGGA